MREYAETQEGLVARHHLDLLEVTRQQWARARTNGRWRSPSDRVIAAAGSPANEPQRVLAAVFDAGPTAMLHGPSTLAWFGQRGFGLRVIHASRRRGSSALTSTLAVVHSLRDMHDTHVMIARGVPTETPFRAIWTIARGYSSPWQFEVGIRRVGRILDNAHKAGLVRWAALHAMVEELQRSGRYGTVLMRALADARPIGSSPSESGNEDRLEEILREAGARPLRRQVDVGGYEPIGRTDYRDPELPLVVEVNSLVHHTTPSDRANDDLRYRRLNEAGFTVGVVWEGDLWRGRNSVVLLVRQVRRLAAGGEAVVVHSPSCPWPGAVLVSPASG